MLNYITQQLLNRKHDMKGSPASLGGLATALLILGLLIAGSLVIDALT